MFHFLDINRFTNEVYNVNSSMPLNEMIDVIDNALMNGYTVAWGADVSEKGFSFKNGVAIVQHPQVRRTCIYLLIKGVF